MELTAKLSCIAWIYVAILSLAVAESVYDYMQQRTGLKDADNGAQTGATIVLSDDEKKVNALLTHFKHKEVSLGLDNGRYLPSQHFFRAKSFIDRSDVFKIIKHMPKGAALHLHDTAMSDPWWVIKHATYQSNCYMCYNGNGQPLFHFFDASSKLKGCDWKPVSSYRGAYKNPSDFDEQLYRNLTLIVDDPEKTYPTITKVWERFLSLFSVSGGLVLYSKVFKDYYTEALQEFYEDNVQYIEFRGLLPPVYELDGSTHGPEWVLQTYKNLTDSYTAANKDFFGAKLIYTSSRTENTSQIAEAIKRAIYYNKKYPTFFAGYDLVAYEETGHTLLYYLKELLTPAQSGQPLKYFFHAGETDWSGTPVDGNLLDAVLLNTSRIGHGYAIQTHPKVKQVARERGIAIEICPISNQVLKLVSDLRNHPGSALLREGYPVVISADDPALWGARGLSYDFYEAFMGLGGAWADLRTLKQLALDSLRYSAMTEEEKGRAVILWQGKWDEFIQKIIGLYKL